MSDENESYLNIPELKSEIDVDLVQNGDICLICLNHSNNLLLIEFQRTNGTSIEDKLKYFLTENDFNSKHPKYICIKCANVLSEKCTRVKNHLFVKFATNHLLNH